MENKNIKERIFSEFFKKNTATINILTGTVAFQLIQSFYTQSLSIGYIVLMSSLISLVFVLKKSKKLAFTIAIISTLLLLNHHSFLFYYWEHITTQFGFFDWFKLLVWSIAPKLILILLVIKNSRQKSILKSENNNQTNVTQEKPRNVLIDAFIIVAVFLLFSKVIILERVFPGFSYPTGFEGYYVRPIDFLFMNEGILVLLYGLLIPLLLSMFVKFLITFFPIFFILKKSKQKNEIKYIYIFLVLLLFSSLQYFVYREYSPSSQVKNEFETRDQIESDLIKLKTKEKIINYIKNDEKYIDSTCFIENISVSGSRKDFINVPEIEGFLEDSNKTLLCEINEKFDESFVKKFWKSDTISYLERNLEKITEQDKNYFYDCLFLYKNHTSHQICFKDGMIKRLDSAFSNSWVINDRNLGIDYGFFNDKVYVQNLCGFEEIPYAICTKELDSINFDEKK